MKRGQPRSSGGVSLLRIAGAVLVLLLAAHADRAMLVRAAHSDTPAEPQPSDAAEALRQLESAVRAHGARASVDACAGANVVLDANARRVDQMAAKSVPRVARRLAAEFGLGAKALSEQRARLGVSWGDLTIAHTLAANTQDRIPADQLVALHRNGLDWGLLSAGLGLDLGDVVSAVRTEALVAAGALRADGKVPPIRNDGSRSSAPAKDGTLSAERQPATAASRA